MIEVGGRSSGEVHNGGQVDALMVAVSGEQASQPSSTSTSPSTRLRLAVSPCLVLHNLIPIKVNGLIWRIEQDRIPTRLNIMDKGLDLDSLLCPICELVGESMEYIFSMCSQLVQFWHTIASWWSVAILTPISITNILQWAEVSKMSKDNNSRFQAMVAVAMWCIWSYRNKLHFGMVKPRLNELFDDIQYFLIFGFLFLIEVGNLEYRGMFDC
ncbi:hypothetical protein LXL04_021251 [Taraxacum kok-saghyz]